MNRRIKHVFAFLFIMVLFLNGCGSNNNNDSNNTSSGNSIEGSNGSSINDASNKASVYQLDPGSFKYLTTTLRDYIESTDEWDSLNKEGIMRPWGIRINGDHNGYDNLTDAYSDLLDLLGSDADKECVVIYDIYSDLLEKDVESAKEKYPDGFILEFPSEINGYPVYCIDVNGYKKGFHGEKWEKYDFLIPEGVLIEYSTLNKKLSSSVILSYAEENHGTAVKDLSNADNLRFFKGDILNFDSVPEKLLYGQFELQDKYGSKYSGNGQLMVSDKVKFFSLGEDIGCNFTEVNLNSLVTFFGLSYPAESKVDKLIIGSNNKVLKLTGEINDLFISDYSNNYINFDFVYGAWPSTDKDTNRSYIKINNSLTLSGSYTNVLEEGILDYYGDKIKNAPFALRGSSFTVHNLTGKEIDWECFFQIYPEQGNLVFETGRIDMGDYPIDIVNN